jgi:hypothetical protein
MSVRLDAPDEPKPFRFSAQVARETKDLTSPLPPYSGCQTYQPRGFKVSQNQVIPDFRKGFASNTAKVTRCPSNQRNFF